jgi:hypothetical protein
MRVARQVGVDQMMLFETQNLASLLPDVVRNLSAQVRECVCVCVGGSEGGWFCVCVCACAVCVGWGGGGMSVAALGG